MTDRLRTSDVHLPCQSGEVEVAVVCGGDCPEVAAEVAAASGKKEEPLETAL